MTHISVVIVLIISWGLPLFAIVNNWLYPSYSNSLGVAYSFLFGCIIHLISMGIWFFIRCSRIETSQVIGLVASFILIIVLTNIADSGGLS